MQVTALVGGTDDKNSNIVGVCKIDRFTIRIEDVVPMDIAEIKTAVLLMTESLENDIGGPVTREADMIYQPFVLEFSGGRKAAVIPAALLEGTIVVESVEGQ